MSEISWNPLLIPGRGVGEKFCILVENVFSPEECKEIILSSENDNKFQASSLVQDPNKDVGVMMKNPNRNNDRISVFDNNFTEKLYNRISKLVPETFLLDGKSWSKHSCNNRLSILRYNPGEQYSPHVDVEHESEDGKFRSFVTAQIYLNEGFEGGETRFIQEVGYKFISERQHLDVIPKIGSVLLFEHELLHTGRPLISGQKYTIRTDIMYSIN
jgi:predicted 2-oxoglutarate/Fe(II)-dependent dioxygenase YbiX